MYTFNSPAFKSISDLLQEVSGFPVILIFQILDVALGNHRDLAGKCYPQIFFSYTRICFYLSLAQVDFRVKECGYGKLQA